MSLAGKTILLTGTGFATAEELVAHTAVDASNARLVTTWTIRNGRDTGHCNGENGPNERETFPL